FIIALTDNPATVYFTNAVSGLALVTALLMIHPRQQTFAAADETPIESLRAGWRFLRQNRLILSSIGLDMFAVLLGGATYLLPIFAMDSLHVGSAGLGIMRAAPSIGALTMAFFIANRPPFQRSGRILLFAVAGFGVATILFGLSKSFIFSLVM